MNLLRRIIKTPVEFYQSHINRKNRRKLTNRTPTIISSNCTGGILYHWLGLQFKSPFINLWMTNDDFLTAMENFSEFIHTPIKEFKDTTKSYPVGIGAHGVKIYFQHYRSWNEAISKWEERMQRIDTSNMVVMLSNYNGIGAVSNNAAIQGG